MLHVNPLFHLVLSLCCVIHERDLIYLDIFLFCSVTFVVHFHQILISSFCKKSTDTQLKQTITILLQAIFLVVFLRVGHFLYFSSLLSCTEAHSPTTGPLGTAGAGQRDVTKSAPRGAYNCVATVILCRVSTTVGSSRVHHLRDEARLKQQALQLALVLHLHLPISGHSRRWSWDWPSSRNKYSETIFATFIHA